MAAIAYPDFGGHLASSAEAGEARPLGRPAEEWRESPLPVERHLHLVPTPTRLRRRPSQASIYRRRRVVAFVAVLAVALFVVIAARAAVGALGGGPLAASGTPAARAGAAAVYVVQPGDTYWSIARRLHPSGDVRALVDRLSAAHGGAALQAGEQLVLR